MRRWGILVLAVLGMVPVVVLAGTTAENGVLGSIVVEFIVALSKGLLDAPTSSAIYGIIVLVIVRIIQFALSRIPTKRRTVIGKLVWRLAEILFGKDVALKNDVQAIEDPVERETLKIELKKRFPILDLKIKGE